MDASSTENSLFYNTKHSASPVNILNNELFIMSSPRLSSNPFLSPTSSHYNQFLPAEFSIFQPTTKSQSHTPSDCSFHEFCDAISTQNRLNQASFILENQQLYNNYTLCLSKLHESIKEVDNLREENDNLRLANIELIHRLSLLSRATIQNCLLTSNHYSSPTIDKLSIGNTGKASPSVSPTSVIEQKKFSFPNSISIRSNGTANINKANLSRNITQQRIQDPAFQNQSERACVKKREEEAVELEVYNQGTEKTELCNKWQETGACPYGGNCQFAHGIAELRPVIRHPRYKTEVCRMVLCGKMCPYGHRCHFRHSLTNQERLLQLQRPC